MKKLLTLLCSILLCFAPFAANALETSISKLYQNDKSVKCGGRTYPIPSYFPYMDLYSKDGVYLDADCSGDSLNVYIGLQSDCRGKNICGMASFSFDEVNSRLSSNLAQGFTATAKKVAFGDMEEGYYSPSVCYSYCNEMGLVWFDETRIYTIGAKTSKTFEQDKNELKKAAESYNSTIEGK